MDEYIKREDALDAVLFALVGTGYQSRAINAINELPAVATPPQSEWISVEDRLPERSTRVLAYSKKYNEVDVYYYGGADDWWDNDGWASAKYYEITHWMPLPEAPKMKGGAE